MVLVATSMIETGIDVPRPSPMIAEAHRTCLSETAVALPRAG